MYWHFLKIEPLHRVFDILFKSIASHMYVITYSVWMNSRPREFSVLIRNNLLSLCRKMSNDFAMLVGLRRIIDRPSGLDRSRGLPSCGQCSFDTCLLYLENDIWFTTPFYNSNALRTATCTGSPYIVIATLNTRSVRYSSLYVKPSIQTSLRSS